MRLAVLGMQYASGKFGAVADDSVVGLLDLAREIRASGNHDGKAVVCGAVLSSSRPMPVMQFRCASVQAKPEKPTSNKQDK